MDTEDEKAVSGGNIEMNFITPKAFDLESEEIDLCVCEKCGSFKSCAMGKDHHLWFCAYCEI